MKSHVEYHIINGSNYVSLNDHKDLMNDLEKWKKSAKFTPEEYKSHLVNFAGQAMQGLLACPMLPEEGAIPPAIARVAISNAKELIKQLEESK